MSNNKITGKELLMKDTLIGLSGQSLHFYISAFIIILSIIAIVATRLAVSDVQIIVWFTAFTLIISALVEGVISVRCPDCKNRWVWHVVNNSRISTWKEELYALAECPNCGYTVTKKTEYDSTMVADEIIEPSESFEFQSVPTLNPDNK